MFQLLKNNKISVWRLIFVLIVGGCLGVSTCFADGGDKAVMKIKEIKPPPSYNIPVANQEGSNQPNYFVTGTVDAMGDNWITINDHQFSIAPAASLFCRVGDFVGIQVNDAKQVISCETIIK